MLTGHPPYGGDTPLAVAYQHVHHDVPAPSAEVPGLPWAGRRARRPDDPPRPGRPAAGRRRVPRRARPTCARTSASSRSPCRPAAAPPARDDPAPDQPARPARGTPATPAPRCSAASGPSARARTSMLPAVGAGPTMNVNGRRPAGLDAPAARRPAAHPPPPCPVRRRPIVLLLADHHRRDRLVARAAGGGPSPELVGTDQAAAIDLLQEAGLDPGLLRGGLERGVPRRRRHVHRPVAGRGDPRHRRRASSSPRARSASPSDRRWSASRSTTSWRSCRSSGRRCRSPTTESTTTTVAAGLVIGFDPPAGTELRRDELVTVVVSPGRAPVSVPDVTGQSPEQAAGQPRALGFTVDARRGRPQRRRRRGRGHGGQPRPGRRPGALRQRGDHLSPPGVPLVTVPDVDGHEGGRGDRGARGRRAHGRRARSSSATRCASRAPPPARASSRAPPSRSWWPSSSACPLAPRPRSGRTSRSRAAWPRAGWPTPTPSAPAPSRCSSATRAAGSSPTATRRRTPRFVAGCAERAVPAFIHTPFLVNVGSPTEATVEQSIASIRHNLARGARARLRRRRRPRRLGGRRGPVRGGAPPVARAAAAGARRGAGRTARGC